MYLVFVGEGISNGSRRHNCITLEKRTSLGSGNVPWIASHIIKKLNLANNEASFASFRLMRGVVTISISQLKGA
jgi:hypothetical protein